MGSRTWRFALLGLVPVAMVATVSTGTFAITSGNAEATPAVTPAAKSSLYWANASGDAIARAQINGSHINQAFIQGANTPEDVLVYENRIYWANDAGCAEGGSCADGSIGVANLNGTGSNEDLIDANTPLGLAIEGQYIYWSNSGTNTIGRAKLNGTDSNSNFIDGASTPDGVVVNSRNIYWANDGTNTIGRAKLNGKKANQAFISGADVPEGMAIDSSYLYWANHNDSSIGRATLNGAVVNQTFIAGAGNWPTRVAVDSTNIYWTAWDQNVVPTSGIVGVADIDGSNINNDLISSSESPTGVAVSIK